MSTELSNNDIRQLLTQTINKDRKSGESGYWVRDVYSTYFIYEDYSESSLYKRTYVIDQETNIVTLGEAEQVVERTTYEPLVKTGSFSLPLEGDTTFSTGADGEEYVVRWGKIFETGKWPDKKFSLNEEEMKEAVADFSPVPVDLEHTSTPLDGKLGQLEAVKVAEDGKTLMGGVAFPKWLNTALGNTAIKVSCTWDRATKKLAGIALTNNPRISDAALMSAFADFAGKRNSSTDQKLLDEVHKLIVKAGAQCQTDFSNQTDPNPNSNTEVNPIHMAVENTNPNPGTGAQPTGSQTQTQADFSAVEFAQMKAMIARMQAENAQLKADKRHQEAVAFAEAEVEEHRAFPAERDMLVALFDQAAQDDEAQSVAQAITAHFSSQAGVSQSGNGTSRVAALKALMALRPTHEALFGEQVKVANVSKDGQVMFARTKTPGKAANGQADGETEEEKQARINKMMSMTDAGKKALARKKGGN